MYRCSPRAPRAKAPFARSSFLIPQRSYQSNAKRSACIVRSKRDELKPAERVTSEKSARGLGSSSEKWQPASLTGDIGPSKILMSTVLAAGAGGLLGLLPNLDGPLSTIEAILVLCGIVAFHELGHFSAARLQGIHVSKFAIGFGPTLFSITKGDVEYSLRALPLGGFVAFPDNDEDCPYPEDDPDLLKNRPILDRFFVISAGVVFNLILAFAVLTAQVSNYGYSIPTYNPGVRVPIVMKNSAADRYGLLPGDTILALDDAIVQPGPDAVKTVVQTIKAHRDISIDVTVARGNPVEIKHVMVLPDIAPDGGGRIGVQLSANADIVTKKPDGPTEVVARAGEEMGRLLGATAGGLAGMFGNLGQAAENVSGPVAVVAVGAEVARASPSGLYAFAAVVNINLAIVNVLPLPALDGGYLVLLLIEAARRGKKLPEEVEQGFMASGFLLLMALSIVLIAKDTINLLPK